MFPHLATECLLLTDFSGPPGVGKTLTAETLAGTFKVPLYTVCIELGNRLLILANFAGGGGPNRSGPYPSGKVLEDYL